MVDGQDKEPPAFHQEGSTPVFEKPKSQEESARERRESEQHEFARAQVNTNKKLAWFTGALMVATFCTIGVGMWQANISQKAAGAAKSAADTALQTLEHAKANDSANRDASLKSFKEEERAYVSATFAAMSSPPICSAPLAVNGIRVCVDVHYVNTGRTPAVGVRMYRYATFGPGTEKTVEALKVPPYKKPAELPPWFSPGK